MMHNSAAQLDHAPPDSSPIEPRMTFRQRQVLRLTLLKARVKEYLTYDSVIFRKLAGLVGLASSWLMNLFGRTQNSFILLSKLHRANFLGMANRRAERLTREAAACAAKGSDHPVLRLYEEHVEQLRPIPQSEKFLADPSLLLGSLAMVLKSPSQGEKGVLLLQYSYTFPLFAKLFDLPRVAEKYYIVLEPDWSGYCDPNILAYCRYRFPVFVQAYEPRDAALIENLRSNLVAVPTSTNWWVDHRLFQPLSNVDKDVDAVMVAGWGHYKRHAAFFAALEKLRRRGHRLRVLLLGYPIHFSREELLRQAEYHHVADQLEIHEWVPYESVNEFVNRARVNVIWSRKEGVNRAIIEGMFAGVPCLVREGFNYGYHYPYINRQTGAFATELSLPDQLLSMIETSELYRPREWVMENMSCQLAASILSNAIGKIAVSSGEQWSGDLAVKVNKLHGVDYWTDGDTRRFETDHQFLRNCRRL